MISTTVDATIHYRHTPAEVADLDAAVVRMGEYIARCSRHEERYRMRQLLQGEYFRHRDAVAMKTMLLRAVKFARACAMKFSSTPSCSRTRWPPTGRASRQ
jgi:hypothetical protein